MLVLDTDHISILGEPSEAGLRLLRRLRDSNREAVTSVVTVEENLQGWLAAINCAKAEHQLIRAYVKFRQRVEFFADWFVLHWDEDSSCRFRELRKQGVRIGTHDLRIASISLAHDSTILTRNTSDFAQVPGLKFENWLDD